MAHNTCGVSLLTLERRLRPIYDSLDVGNNKKALQETEKVLKKTPSLQCARALKALALIRLGRDVESDPIIEQIVATNPSDDSTLQALTCCYRELEQLDKICTLYTNAVKQDPNNEEILSHLFMSHVRVNDYQSQQTVALQLYKLKSKNPYYFWAVMSVVLKALRGPDSKSSDKRKLLLELAQRMVDKFLSADKLDVEQEAQLYLNILQYQEKYPEALAFLEGDVGKKLYPGAPISLKIDLLEAMGKWTELNVLLKELLQEHRDRWDYYKQYIKTVVKLLKTDEKCDGADVNFEMCHEFLCQQIESGVKKVRGPYLGRLELYRTMAANDYDAQQLMGDYLEMLIEYFRMFGDKPCCANDIVLFLDHLDVARRPQLATMLIRVSEISAKTLPQSKEQMQKHICSLQISRICGAHQLSVDHLAALYTAFSLHYELGKSAFGSDLLPTDMGPSDPYALLAVHVMYDLSVKDQSSDRIVEALCLLQYLLGNSPSNYHAKLLCVQLYNRIGCSYGAHKMYDSLDAKNVQLDSLGYLHCQQLPLSGIPSIAKPLYDVTLKFFTSSYKDSAEYLAMCYKFGSFSKLLEFMDFRDRLVNSYHYALIATEALLLEIVCLSGTIQQNLIAYRSMCIQPFDDRVNWSELTDNRDLTVIARWDPIDSVRIIEMEKSDFRQSIDLLHIRTIQLRLLGSCVEALVKDAAVDPDKTIVCLEKLHGQWLEEFVRIRRLNWQPIASDCLVNLLPSRLHGLLALPYEDFFSNLAKLIIGMETGKWIPDGERCCTDVRTIGNLLCSTIEQHNLCDDLIWNRRSVQEMVVGVVEMLSLSAFLLSVCQDHYHHITLNKHAKKTKRKGKSNGSVTENGTVTETLLLPEKERLQIVTTIIGVLKTEITNCDQALSSWKSPCVSTNLVDSLAALSLNIKVDDIVHGTLKQNHQITVTELKQILKDKIRLLNK